MCELYESKFKNHFESDRKCLGMGSFGIVYKVKSLVDSQIYAIKKIKFKKINDNIYQSGIKELSLLSQLKSKYVVQYFDAWMENNYVYIQMEFCSCSLGDIIKSAKTLLLQPAINDLRFALIDYFISIELFEEIVKSLDVLHTNNPPIIHRDLKPENILISNDLNESKHFLKICDFGLAKTHQYDGQSHTNDKGDIVYMAPEVGYGRSYDIKADIYSLGIIASKDLFNVNTENWEKSMDKKNPELRPKYDKLIKPISNMLEFNDFEKRPDCKELLSEVKEWGLTTNEIQNIQQFSHIFETLSERDKKFFNNFLLAKINLRLNSETEDIFDDEIDGRIRPSISMNESNKQFMNANELDVEVGDIVEIKGTDYNCSTIWALYVGQKMVKYLVSEKQSLGQTYKIVEQNLEYLVQGRMCRVNNLDKASQRLGLSVQNTDQILNTAINVCNNNDLIDSTHNLRIHFVSKCRFGREFCENDESFDSNNTFL